MQIYFVFFYFLCATTNNCTELKRFCQMIYAAAPRAERGSRYICAIHTPSEVFFWPNACPAVIDETPAMVLGAAAGLMRTS